MYKVVWWNCGPNWTSNRERVLILKKKYNLKKHTVLDFFCFTLNVKYYYIFISYLYFFVTQTKIYKPFFAVVFLPSCFFFFFFSFCHALYSSYTPTTFVNVTKFWFSCGYLYVWNLFAELWIHRIYLLVYSIHVFCIFFQHYFHFKIEHRSNNIMQFEYFRTRNNNMTYKIYVTIKLL